MKSDRIRHVAGTYPSVRAFTLVELLVVIAIVAVLASILLPLVMRSYRSAGRIRAQSDLQTIATALEAYKQDHGDIPRIPVSKYPPTVGLPLPNLGAAILCKALLGPFGDGITPTAARDDSDPPLYRADVEYQPGDVYRDTADPNKMYVTLVAAPKATPSSETSIFAPFDAHDGADGTGFRKRLGGAGPVSPAYLQAGKIPFRGSFLLDHYGNPVLYFPAHPRKRDLTLQAVGPGREPYVDLTAAPPADPNPPLYDAMDNIEMFARRAASGLRIPTEQGSHIIPLKRVRVMLGDYNFNGSIDNSETPVMQSYLLWTAGPDGVVGPTGIDIQAVTAPDQLQRAVAKCDDIVNFR